MGVRSEPGSKHRERQQIDCSGCVSLGASINLLIQGSCCQVFDLCMKRCLTVASNLLREGE